MNLIINKPRRPRKVLPVQSIEVWPDGRVALLTDDGRTVLITPQASLYAKQHTIGTQLVEQPTFDRDGTRRGYNSTFPGAVRRIEAKKVLSYTTQGIPEVV